MAIYEDFDLGVGKIREADITTFKVGGTAVSATAAEMNKLSGVTATTAEINKLAGVTAGTRTASKAVVVGASGEIDRFDVGKFASALAGSGTALSASVTAASRVYADDANAALATGTSARAFVARTLIQHAQEGDLSIFGAQGQVKAVGALTHTGHIAGLWGYAELPSGASTTGPVAGVYAMADAASGATIGSGGVVSGLLVSANDLQGTHTGRAVAVHVQNPVAGDFDALFEIGDSTGCTQATAASGGTSKYLKVYIGGVLHTVEATTTA